jgi:hypothetical protein
MVFGVVAGVALIGVLVVSNHDGAHSSNVRPNLIACSACTE